MLHIPWKNVGLVIGSMGTLWGVVFSVYTVRHQNKKSKPKIKATCSAGANVYGSELSEAMLYVSALNLGDKAINITSVIVELPNKQHLTLIDPRMGSGLPYQLDPEHSARYWFSLKSVAQTLQADGYKGTVAVKGIIRDAIGREYKSKGCKIKTIGGWAKS
ncbi:MAG TPA: hypothetical protein VGF75_02710 [Candidatus Saccharimonadales bacterium]|jgi:hypothetical protein